MRKRSRADNTRIKYKNKGFVNFVNAIDRATKEKLGVFKKSVIVRKILKSEVELRFSESSHLK